MVSSICSLVSKRWPKSPLIEIWGLSAAAALSMSACAACARDDAAPIDGLALSAAASASSSVSGRAMGASGQESVPGASPVTCR